MSNEIRISGASDDLVEVDGYVSEEYSVNGNGDWEGKLIEPGSGDGLRVTVKYTSNGTWSVGVAPLADEAFLPSWPIAIGNARDCDYSAELRIEVPDGTTLAEVAL